MADQYYEVDVDVQYEMWVSFSDDRCKSSALYFELIHRNGILRTKLL